MLLGFTLVPSTNWTLLPFNFQVEIIKFFFFFFLKYELLIKVVKLGNKTLTGTDNPHCYCTIIDKDHEATMTTVGIEDYFRLLYIEVNMAKYNLKNI